MAAMAFVTFASVAPRNLPVGSHLLWDQYGKVTMSAFVANFTLKDSNVLAKLATQDLP